MSESVATIRRAIPDFGHRRLGAGETMRLCEEVGIDVLVCDMACTAAVLPPIAGRYRMFLSSRVPTPARAFVLLHELCHVIRGDADELVQLVLDETRYPCEDRIADGLAAFGVTTPRERGLATGELGRWLQASVPIRSRAWQRYRVHDVAALLGHLTHEENGGDRWL